jgi:hypothetical protein
MYLDIYIMARCITKYMTFKMLQNDIQRQRE